MAEVYHRRRTAELDGGPARTGAYWDFCASHCCSAL